MWLIPEIQRNVWADFSVNRLILAPLFIGLAVYLAYLIGNAHTGSSIAYVVALFFIYIIGIKNAAETVIDEVNAATWDFQRQTAVAPLNMTIGKLLGSTLYSWYVAFIGLFCYLFLSPPSDLSIRLQETLVLIVGGLSGQAIALLLSLLGLPLIHRQKTHKPFRYIIAGIVIAWAITALAFNALQHAQSQTHWYGWAFETTPFIFVSLALFLGWIFLGLWRTFRQELQVAQLPWAWFCFNVFCIGYFPGLVSFDLSKLFLKGATAQPNVRLEAFLSLSELAPYLTAFFIALALIYIALFADKISVLRYFKGMKRYLNHQNIKEYWVFLPWWPISFVLTLVIYGVILVTAPSIPDLSESFSLNAWMLTNIGFIMRDILIAHYCYFAPNAKNALLNFSLYLLILYLLLPGILGILKLTDLLPLLLPSFGSHNLLAAFGIFIQIAVMGYLCLIRWRKTLGQVRD